MAGTDTATLNSWKDTQMKAIVYTKFGPPDVLHVSPGLVEGDALGEAHRVAHLRGQRHLAALPGRHRALAPRGLPHVSGHVLHTLFWNSMSPDKPDVPDGLAELSRCSGTQFDPEMVDAFVAAVERQLAAAHHVEADVFLA